MSQITLRYTFVENPLQPKTTLVLNQASVEARITAHPLLPQVKEIHLKVDEYNQACFNLLKKGEITIEAGKSREFVKRCRQVFGLEVRLDCGALGVGVLLGAGPDESNAMDELEFEDLMAVIKATFNGTGEKLHGKIIRKLRIYVKNTKRADREKDLLNSVIKAYKQSESIQEEQDQATEPKSKTQVKPEQPKKQKNKQPPIKEKVEIDSPVHTKTSIKAVRSPKQRPAHEQSENDSDSSDVVEPLKQFASHQGSAHLIGDADEEEAATLHHKVPKGKYGGHRNKRHHSRNKGENDRQDRNSRDRYDRNGSTSKDKLDPKILLGITGDTEFGWRQRNRPVRVPLRQAYTKDESSQFSEKEASKKNKDPFVKPKKISSDEPVKIPEISYTKQNKSATAAQTALKVKKQIGKLQSVQADSPKKQTVVSKPAKAKQPEKIIDHLGRPYSLMYTYPKDGTAFNFKKLHDEFLMHINGNFWISYKQATLSLTKGEHGYIRKCKVDLLNNSFMAEGLTISLEGTSNIEDGGDTLGNPTVSMFTGNESQFFHLVTLEIYVPKA